MTLSLFPKGRRGVMPLYVHTWTRKNRDSVDHEAESCFSGAQVRRCDVKETARVNHTKQLYHDPKYVHCL